MVNRVESSPLVLAGGDYKVAILLHFHQSIYVFCWMHDIFFFLCHYVIFFLISQKFLLYIEILFRLSKQIFFSNKGFFSLFLGSLGQFEICYVLQN